MSYIKKILTGAACLVAIFTADAASSRQSVLQIPTYNNDSTVVFPESVETDTHKMMQNWYLQTYTALDQNIESRPDVDVTDEEYIRRLGAIPTTIEMPYNSIVKQCIERYTKKGRGLVEAMLGMSLYYMPIFEDALERQGLPQELKYLPVIESALDPNAVSKAGATGLWQLMLQTARGMGMEVNTLVDERRDPYRSTEVAATFLRQLYDIYGDWSLAIAAYNCGPSNVNKALRRAGASENNPEKKDFWAIYEYLPRETRGYVPGFIAATYVMNYYNKHNISPALAKRPIITDSVHVNKRVHFQQISDILQIPVEEIAILNPQYRQSVIPGDIAECSLVLPANQVYSYIISEDAIVNHDADRYRRRDIVQPGQDSGTYLASENGRKDADYAGENADDSASDLADASEADEPDEPDEPGYTKSTPLGSDDEGEWVVTEEVRYHKVKKGETMASIAEDYGVSLWTLKHANGDISNPTKGQKLKIVTTQRVFQRKGEPQADDNLVVRKRPQQPKAETASVPAPRKKEQTQQPEVPYPPKTQVSDSFASSQAKKEAAKETASTTSGKAASKAPAKASSKADTAEQPDKSTKADKKSAKITDKETASTSTSGKKNKKSLQAQDDSNSKNVKGKKGKNSKETASSKKNKKNKKKESTTVTVKKGDSLSRIAKRNGTTVKELQRLNGKKSENLQPGDKIRVK